VGKAGVTGVLAGGGKLLCFQVRIIAKKPWGFAGWWGPRHGGDHGAGGKGGVWGRGTGGVGSGYCRRWVAGGLVGSG